MAVPLRARGRVAGTPLPVVVRHGDRVGTDALHYLRRAVDLADPRLDRDRVAALDAEPICARHVDLHVVGGCIGAERLVQDRVVDREARLVAVHPLVRDDVERIVRCLAMRCRERVVLVRQGRIGDLVFREIDLGEVVLLGYALDLVIGVDQLVGVELDLRLARALELVFGTAQVFRSWRSSCCRRSPVRSRPRSPSSSCRPR